MINKTIKAHLRKKGITQAELSKMLNITQPAVSKMLNGEISERNLKAIADAIGLDVKEITDFPEDIKEVIYSGDLTIGSIVLPCYILKDGTRVLSGRGMQDALNMVDESTSSGQKAGTRLSRHLNQESIKPFIYNGVEEDHFIPIKCIYQGKSINGYEATILVDICEAFLDARQNINLSPRQALIAERSEILMRAFAKTGIIALVDEATGYDKAKERAKNELQKYLNTLISKEASSWVKTFDDEFFEGLYKMRGWTWNTTHKHPGVVGNYINDIVYERIGKEFLEELQRLNPKNEKGVRSKRHHQYLTSDNGIQKLKERLAVIKSFMLLSDYNWGKFMRMVDKAFPKPYYLKPLFADDEIDL